MTITPTFEPNDTIIIFDDKGKYITTEVEAILLGPITQAIDPDTFIRYQTKTNDAFERRIVREQGVTFATKQAVLAYVNAQP